MPTYADILAAFAGTGLVVRGGFAAEAGETLPEAGPRRPGRAIVLLGNAGPGLWAPFAAAMRPEPDPLDEWTRRTVAPIASRLCVRDLHPNDRPYQPFQRWARRAEPVHPSPIGLLIHPVWGLWHAYRAALVLAEVPDDLPARGDRPSPCASCSERPCLSACPVRAFDGHSYDVAACAAHLESPGGPACLEGGCRAREACPVGHEHRYGEAQVRFHMAAFRRSRQ